MEALQVLGLLGGSGDDVSRLGSGMTGAVIRRTEAICMLTQTC